MKNIEVFEKWKTVNEGQELSMSIDTLINTLTELKKKGKKNVEVSGTLMCKEDGNAIIASTEKQI